MGLLDGKKGLILNIANDRSIAWHIANNAIKQGADLRLRLPADGQPEKCERRVRKAMEEGGFGDAWLHPCDVGKRRVDRDVLRRRARSSSARSTSSSTRLAFANETT